jgi:hypothetical protein
MFRSFFRIKLFIFFFSVTVILFSSCQKEIDDSVLLPVYNLNLHFVSKVGTLDLEFGKTYLNASGEPFSIRAFKFYITNIQLINHASGETYAAGKDDYYLVDFSKNTSTVLQVKTKPSTYNRIQFEVGVDSVHNVSGAQTGALDPANGMFWTWNSGYIMAKLEGYSPASNQPNNLFEYHIGGFKGVDKVQQTILLDLPVGKQIVTQNGGFSDAILSADAARWFSGSTTISIASLPAVMTPGDGAKAISENYAHMFSVQEIINQ